MDEQFNYSNGVSFESCSSSERSEDIIQASDITPMTLEQLYKEAEKVADYYLVEINATKIDMDNALEEELLYVEKVKKLDSLKSDILKIAGKNFLLTSASVGLVFGIIEIFTTANWFNALGCFIGLTAANDIREIANLLDECGWPSRKEIRQTEELCHQKSEEMRKKLAAVYNQAIREVKKIKLMLLQYKNSANYITEKDEEFIEYALEKLQEIENHKVKEKVEELSNAYLLSQII